MTSLFERLRDFDPVHVAEELAAQESTLEADAWSAAVLAELLPTGQRVTRDRLGRFSKRAATGLPELDWVDPPPPEGVRRGQAGGYSSDRAYGTNTELGRAGEAAFIKLTDGESLHTVAEQSPLDVRAGDYGVEVKAASVKATHYKASPKKYEIAEKLAAAEKAGLIPAMSIVVVDEDAAYVYWREGLAPGRLSPATGWKYAGRVPIAPGQDVTEALSSWFGRIAAERLPTGQFVNRDRLGRFSSSGFAVAAAAGGIEGLTDDQVRDLADELDDVIGDKKSHDPGDGEDQALKAVLQALGDPKPRVVERLPEGEQVFYRGIGSDNPENEQQAAEYADQFMHGSTYVGKGVSGNGIWVTTNPVVATGYANYGGGTWGAGRVLRMTLDNPKLLSDVFLAQRDVKLRADAMSDRLSARQRQALNALALNSSLTALVFGYDGVRDGDDDIKFPLVTRRSVVVEADPRWVAQ